MVAEISDRVREIAEIRDFKRLSVRMGTGTRSRKHRMRTWAVPPFWFTVHLGPIVPFFCSLLVMSWLLAVRTLMQQSRRSPRC